MSASSQVQATRVGRLLTDVPLDLLGEVYAFQAAFQQAALRATCVRLADAFDGAVRNELVDAAIVRGGGVGVDVTESAVSGLRSTRMCPTSGAEITGGAFREFVLVNDAGKFTRRANTPVRVQRRSIFFVPIATDSNSLLGYLVQIRRLEIAHFGDMPTTLDPLSSLLHRATRLQHIVMCSKPGSASLRAFGEHTLANCPELTTVSLANLIALESIGANCLKGCVSLTSVSFANLPALRSVGDDWLRDCRALTKVTFAGMPRLTTVGDNWLRSCEYLEEADFGQLAKLQRVGRRWLGECDRLHRVNYSGLESLEAVDDGWMYACRNSLREVRLVGLRSLKTIGNSFLSHCSALESLTIYDAYHLEEIGEYWLYYGVDVTTVDTRGLQRLQRFGGTPFAYCRSMKFVNLPDAVLIKPGTAAHRQIVWIRGEKCRVVLPDTSVAVEPSDVS
jgi:hypothetical protein